MFSALQDFTAAHRYLLETVARAAPMADPLAFSGGHLHWPLIRASRRADALPVDGVLIHDWSVGNRKPSAGIRLGMRLYTISDIRFASVHCSFTFDVEDSAL